MRKDTSELITEKEWSGKYSSSGSSRKMTLTAEETNSKEPVVLKPAVCLLVIS